MLLEVAAGRRNLSPAVADELHAAIDAEQAPAAPEPIAENSSPQTAEVNASVVPPPVYTVPTEPAQATAGVPWQS